MIKTKYITPKKAIKQTLALTLALVFFTYTAFAAPANNKTEEQAKELAGMFYETMLMIMDTYLGNNATPESLFSGAMEGMLKSLNDPYSQYFTKDQMSDFFKVFDGELFGVGISLEVTENGELRIIRVIRDSPAERQGLLIGDIIKKLNGKSMTGVQPEAAIEVIAEKDITTLEINRNGKDITYEIQKELLFLESVFVERLEENKNIPKSIPKNTDLSKVRYIRIETIGKHTADEVRIAIENLKAEGVTSVILDLRDNPGGYLDIITQICNMLVPEGVAFYSVSAGNEKKAVYTTLKTKPFEKMVVLTNSATASSAEILSAALQDSKAATLIGTTTLGKGVMQGIVTIENNGGFKLTTHEWLRRNGNKINNSGVVPDIFVSEPVYIDDAVTLQKDNTGTGMDKIKTALRFLGYETGSIDTKLDTKTAAAIKNFQKKNGLTQSGFADITTIKAINEVMYKFAAENDEALAKALEVVLK